MNVTNGHIVEAYFDFGSPWSYLASELAPRRLPGVTIDWRPMYLRGLEPFSKGPPYTGVKLAYMARDLARCAEHEGIPLLPPTTFPVDGLHALRGALVAKARGALDRYRPAMFRAAWAEQKDIADKATVIRLLADALGDASTASLADAIAAQPVKDALREATAEAVARDVFGLPAFFVGSELFWGHDRLDYVARAAARPH